MREQSFRDPVHDFITINDDYVLRLIDAPEFQRLRRIRQLGATFTTYHGAEQSRFGHSLGSYWIMQRIIDRLSQTGHDIPAGVREVAICAALLHDIGHGPLSHAMEQTITPNLPHEDWSIAIITGDTTINRILSNIDATLPAQVATVLAGTYQGPSYVPSLVSSQLDVDRMDYLVRDSLYTGVTYGQFDLNRVINSLQLDTDQVVVAAKGTVAIEEYVLARYFMYWQVYLHKATRSQEMLLRQAWRRAHELQYAGVLAMDEVPPALRPFLLEQFTLSDYLALDDYDVFAALKTWSHHSDTILADLATRFLDRRLLKPVFKVPHTADVSAQLHAAAALVARAGWDPSYYLLVDHCHDLAYDTYTAEIESESDADAEQHKQPILACDAYGRPTEISRLSETIRAIASRPRRAVNIYVPADTLAAVRGLYQL